MGIIHNKYKNNIKKIKDIIYLAAKRSKIDINISFEFIKNSQLAQDNNNKYYIFLENNSLENKNTSQEYKIVFKLIDLFHEYKHYLQHTRENSLEIDVSIELGKAYSSFKLAKYPLLSQELDAEIYGIMETKEYIEKYLPNIDFEKHLLEYVNNVERWYGIEFLENRKPIFSSYNQVIQYLIDNLENSYDYPVVFYYNDFLSQQESSNLAYLKSGAEQQYVLAKELLKKEKIDADIVEKSKILYEFYSNKSKEDIEDIKLDIPKEKNNRMCTTFNEDKLKEDFDEYPRS